MQNRLWLNKLVNKRLVFVRFDLMMPCQLDSETKQLAIAPSGFGVLHSPFWALGMVFLPG
ncbi:hypothetical protein EHZ86_10995 [Aeromonas australiensis]|uniref:hypothetical protein n=1 Tax=Aeromonas australiensis TaxID=1114880 RepID=UPI001F39791E|nr:hypothetical protein [Aeromonas australiensis]MCF3097809.1 hypothetical protein [Aeromonas australiensis]